MITLQFFDEQTSGAALASIIRQASKVNGRLLSVTFKSNDVWEVHTVISIYAVTNAKSTKKYASSNRSRKDVNIIFTKALEDELIYLQKPFGDAPISIIGDFQDTIHADHRDNMLALLEKRYIQTALCKSYWPSVFNPHITDCTQIHNRSLGGMALDLQGDIFIYRCLMKLQPPYWSPSRLATLIFAIILQATTSLSSQITTLRKQSKKSLIATGQRLTSEKSHVSR